MNQLFRFGLILGIICLVATLVLAVTYEVTRPKIEKVLASEEAAALKAILPGADSFTEKSSDGIEYFEAYKSGSLAGYCVRVTASGYNGYIRIVVGVDTGGVIKGVEVLEQSETPGLGAKISEILPGENEPFFLRQFKGKQARTVAVKKDIDAITGATISSAAVTDAIRETVNKFFQKVRR
jgi:electron transport complex protein RnfG